MRATPGGAIGVHAMRDVHEVLRTHWGFDAFRTVQEDVINSVLSGRDTLALLPTGGGKSLCFQVPALAMGRMCLVVSPLIALMRDQVARLKKQGIAARSIDSSMTKAEIENTLDSALAGRIDFLYVSPERLGTDHFTGRFPQMPIGLIAVDEAHCISQWGYDFRPAYLKIAALRDLLPKVPVLALTASATPIVAKDIMDRLRFTSPHIIRSAFRRPELSFWVSRGEDKLGRLLRILQRSEGTAIIYQRERKGTVRTAQFLHHHGFKAAAYHAGMDHADRDRIQREWTTGNLRIVAATNAFGMGIDKADVRCVVHMAPPPDLESYYQEAGRAGRDGDQAYAFMLIGPDDEDDLREKLEASFPSIEIVRRVYQAFADLNAIAIGSGLMETYPIDLRAIADRTGSPVATVAHSLKALELDGRIALSEGVRTPSRVFITAPASTIYSLRVSDVRNGPLIEALLRSHGGLFEEAAVIDEIQLARMNQWQESTVIERLKDLQRMNVLSYRRRSDSPALTLLRPREDAKRIHLDPEALKLRRERAIVRSEAMIGYFNNNTQCRESLLLSYFGEEIRSSCGKCDVCRSGSRTDPVHGDLGDREKVRWAKEEYGEGKDGDA